MITRQQGLPLFLLNTVFFPEQRLPLRVFEARYLDMVSACFKSGSPFGICLIRRGAEVGEAAEPETVGTLAHIEKWDMPQQGVLHVLARGGRRFEVERAEQRGKLTVADVSLWSEEPPVPVPESDRELSDFLRRIMLEVGDDLVPEPYRFDDAGWVGMRLAQLLPVDNRRKQAWLAERAPLMRLGSIRDTLTTLARSNGAP
ncbi:MAG TPA: LON peptidase substrate-binding domain-containing protein [Acidiferrobacterales bacterium]